jgi:hypothetical protein
MVGLVACTYAIKEAGKAVPDWAMALLALLLGTAFLAIFVHRQRRSATRCWTWNCSATRRSAWRWWLH